jgi:hypothetical protein
MSELTAIKAALLGACALAALSLGGCSSQSQRAAAGSGGESGSGNGGAAAPPAAGQPGAVDAGYDAGTPCVEPAAGALPDDVFCIGLYRDHDPTKYMPSALPYTPGVTLWSDGAEKQRYFALPPSTQIDTSNMDAWKFPAGTTAFKEFRFDGKLVETRFFWKQADGTWLSGTYIWDAAQSSAPLNTSRQPVLLDTGYEIPTAKDCGKCHHGGADYLLGIEAVALALPTAQGVTLASLAKSNALSHVPAQTSIALPEDSTGKAGWALGYLHANCGMPCHSGRGLGEETALLMRLRADEFWSADGKSVNTPVAMTDTYVATYKKDPTTASVAQAYPGALRITPGAHDKSVVWLLAHNRGKYQMPPLVSHKIDDAAMQKLGDWIDALP